MSTDYNDTTLIQFCREKQSENPLWGLENLGVYIYFMSRVLSLQQLEARDKDAVGENGMKQYVFLGKGFYFALCSSDDAEYTRCLAMLTRPWSWVNGILPCMGNIEVTHSLLLVHEVVALLWKVLFVPKLEYLILRKDIMCLCVMGHEYGHPYASA